MIAFMEARSFLVEQSYAHQFDDVKLCLIRDKVLSGEAKEVVLDFLMVSYGSEAGFVCLRQAILLDCFLRRPIVLGIPSIRERRRCIMI